MIPKVFAFMLIMLLGPLGQLIVRFTNYAGSFDKWWLLFFSFPPASIFPAILMAFKIPKIWTIKDGPLNEGYPITDFFSFPGILANTLVISNIVSVVCDTSDFLTPLIILLYNMLFLMVSRMFRFLNVCPKDSNKGLLASYLESGSMIIISSILQTLLLLMKFAPYIGMVFKSLNRVLFLIPGLIDGLFISMSYVIINAFYKYEIGKKELAKNCYMKSIQNYGTSEWIRFSVLTFLTILFTYGLYFIKNFI